MKFVIGLLSLAIVPSLSFGQTPKSQGIVFLSFGELPKLVQEKNENLKAARVHVEAQEKRTGHLTRSFLPQVSANYGNEEFKYANNPAQRKPYWRLGGSLNVYRGGKDAISEQIREKQVERAKSDLTSSYQSELKLAQGFYWDLVAIQKMMELRQEELVKNEENIRSSRRRSGAGVTTSADAVQFELNRTSVQQSLRSLELRRDVSRNQLSILLGLSEHENLVAKEEFPKVDGDTYGALDVEKNAVIKSARFGADIDQLKSRQSSRWWHPKLDLYGSYGLPSLDDEYDRSIRKEKETTFGFLVSLDFGESFSDFAESRAQALDAKSESHRLNTLTRQTVAADHELRHDILLAANMVAENEKNVEKARQFLNLTRNEYNRGVKNGPDLLSASRQYYELQDRTLELNRDLQAAKAELRSLIAQGEELP